MIKHLPILQIIITICVPIILILVFDLDFLNLYGWNDEELLQTLYYCLFLVSILFVAIKASSSWSRPLNYKTLKFSTTTIVFISIIFSILIDLYKFQTNQFFHGINTGISNSGIYSEIIKKMEIINYLAIPLLISKKKWKYLFFTLLIYCIPEFFSGSKERFLLPILIATVFYYKNGYKLSRQQIIVLVLGLNLFLVSNFSLRNQNFESYEQLGNNPIAIFLARRINESSAMVAIVSQTKYQSRQDELTYFQDLKSIVPRFFWPSKPKMTSNNEFAREYGLVVNNDFETSMGRYWYGESYMNLGYFGLVIAIIYGVLYSRLYNTFKSQRVVNSYLGFMMIYFLIRYDTLVLGILSLFRVYILFLTYLLILSLISLIGRNYLENAK